MSKVLIIGIGGQGEATVLYSLKDPSITELRIADINEERVNMISKKSEKISPMRVDAFEYNEVLNAAKGVDVVINTTAARKKVPGNPKMVTPTSIIMDATLEAGANYVDVAVGGDMEEKLGKNEKFKDKNLTGIIDLGKTPGITNLMTKYASSKLDEVEKVKIMSTLDVVSDEFVLMWSPYSNIMGFNPKAEATIYDKGEFKSIAPNSGEEVVIFPNDPQGPVKVYNSTHGEVRSIPRYIKTNFVEWKHGQHISPTLKVLAELFGSFDPISVKGVEVAPADLMLAVIPPVSSIPEKIKSGAIKDVYSCCVVEVEGKKAGAKTRITLSSPINQSESEKALPGSQPESIMVGTPPVIAASMLIKGEIKQRGVMYPEALDAEICEKILSRLVSDVGLKIYENVQKDWA